MKEYMDNYSDLSDERGFQFEFFCESCGNLYRTSYERFSKGAIGERVAGMFSGILGGFVETKVEKMKRDALDAYQEQAMNQVRDRYHRCGICSNWVCNDCWVPQEKSCKNCSVMIQAERQAQIIGQSAAAAAQAFQNPEDTVPKGGLICPHCNRPAGSGKFCQECGAALGPTSCPSCGSPLALGAKFCGECGKKIE